jgi:hypothetical protein
MPRTFPFDEFGPCALSVQTGRYARGSGLAVKLIDASDGSDYADVSLDLGIQDLADDEFVCKTFNSHFMLLSAMLEAGIVELTGRVVAVGAIGPQPVCRYMER